MQLPLLDHAGAVLTRAGHQAADGSGLTLKFAADGDWAAVIERD